MTATQNFRIAAIPADGVGLEVVEAGRAVLDSLAESSGGRFTFEWKDFPWGSEYYAEHGKMMADDGLEQLKTVRRHLLRRRRLARRSPTTSACGACGWRSARASTSRPTSAPCEFLPGIVTPLRKADDTDWNWVVVRENTEGEYAGIGGRNLSARGEGGEVAIQAALFTEDGCERIMRFAFDLARTRKRKKVTSVTKSNAQQYGMVLWDDVFKQVAADYPDVETESGWSTPWPPSSCSTPRTSPSWSPRTCSPTSSPTSAAHSPEAWASPPAPI